MKSFLKWPGGKRWLVKELGEAIGKIDGQYIEPFLGSASLFFHIEPKLAHLSDSNQRLIETFIGVMNSPHSLVAKLEEYHKNHSKTFYYDERGKRHKDPLQRAAQFLYLNRTCFNGIYRVNLQGEFNVPIGTKTNVIMPEDDFFANSELLQRAILRCCDFEESIDTAMSGDVVFCDPPYTVKHNSNGFVKYNENIFAWSDQIRLRDALSRAKARGARIYITNANHPSILDLYSKDWFHYELSRKSVIAGKTDARSPITELLSCSEPISCENIDLFKALVTES